MKEVKKFKDLKKMVILNKSRIICYNIMKDHIKERGCCII